MSERPHGYARYSLDGCRCYVCAWARAQYNDRRERLIRLGQWQPFVDPGVARAHAERLRAAGFGTRQIAALAGLNRKALQDVLNGRTRRIRPATHAAVLAVPDGAELADKTLTPACGTCRRIQALAANGWSLPVQAREVGWLPGNFHALLKRPQITAQTARLVRDLYDRWSALPPPAGADLSRRRARERSWFPPGAWDADTIDDPAVLPCLLPPVGPVDAGLEVLVQQLIAGHPVAMTAAARAEIVRRMPDRQLTEIAPIAQCSTERVRQLRVLAAAPC